MNKTLKEYPNNYDLGKRVMVFNLNARLIKRYPNLYDLGAAYRKLKLLKS